MNFLTAYDQLIHILKLIEQRCRAETQTLDAVINQNSDAPVMQADKKKSFLRKMLEDKLANIPHITELLPFWNILELFGSNMQKEQDYFMMGQISYSVLFDYAASIRNKLAHDHEESATKISDKLWNEAISCLKWLGEDYIQYFKEYLVAPLKIHKIEWDRTSEEVFIWAQSEKWVSSRQFENINLPADKFLSTCFYCDGTQKYTSKESGKVNFCKQCHHGSVLSEYKIKQVWWAYLEDQSVITEMNPLRLKEVDRNSTRICLGVCLDLMSRANSGLLSFDQIEDMIYMLAIMISSRSDMRVKMNTQDFWRILSNSDPSTVLEEYDRILLELAKSPNKKLSNIFKSAQRIISDNKLFFEIIKVMENTPLSLASLEDIKQFCEENFDPIVIHGEHQAYELPIKLVEAMTAVLKPKANEVISDPAMGLGDFLFSAESYVKQQQQEQQSVGSLNLQGSEQLKAPYLVTLFKTLFSNTTFNLQHRNAERRFIDQFEKSDLILCSLPWGQPNLDLESPSDNYMQIAVHLYEIVNNLKVAGRAGIIIPSDFLDKIDKQFIKYFFKNITLHTVLILPKNTLSSPTNPIVIFFQKKSHKADHQVTPIRVIEQKTTDQGFFAFIKAYGKEPDGSSTDGDNSIIRLFEAKIIRDWFPKPKKRSTYIDPDYEEYLAELAEARADYEDYLAENAFERAEAAEREAEARAEAAEARAEADYEE